MRAVIDAEACTACGPCAEPCPEVFRMGEEVAEVIADPVPAGSGASAREAAEGCPMDAITREE